MRAADRYLEELEPLYKLLLRFMCPLSDTRAMALNSRLVSGELSSKEELSSSTNSL